MSENLAPFQHYLLLLSYDGTNYSGWQMQPNAISIQEKIEEALEVLLKEKIAITGSGRTDAGVHAMGQAAHFNYAGAIDPFRFLLAINSILPRDIRIHNIHATSNTFHARYSALSKVYHYHIWQERVILPFYHLYRCHYPHKLCMQSLRAGAELFIGKHDFATFANTGSSAQTTIRTLSRLDIVEQEGGFRLEFEGDGFLYKMVRNVTGTLLELASGKRTLREIEQLLNAKDRRLAGMAAPAKGLFLMHVNYDLSDKKNSGKEEKLLNPSPTLSTISSFLKKGEISRAST